MYLVNLVEGEPEDNTHLLDMSYLHGFGECMCLHCQFKLQSKLKRKEVEPWIDLGDGFWLPNREATCKHQDITYRVLGGTLLRHLTEKTK